MERRPVFVIPKPDNWNRLALYEKVRIYQQYLGQFHSQFVDKINAKKIVKNICGDDIEVARVVRILSGPNDLQTSDIHPNYLIKASHASKWNINIQPYRGYSIPDLRNQLSQWNRIYSMVERQYSYLRPLFFIEEKINDKYHGKDGNATVYMFRCIYGKVRCISIKDNGKSNDYDLEWNLIGRRELGEWERPTCLEKMIENAEKLSYLFEFVRIDFYVDVDNKIYFSEYTFSPMGGDPVLPRDLEYSVGSYWT